MRLQNRLPLAAVFAFVGLVACNSTSSSTDILLPADSNNSASANVEESDVPLALQPSSVGQPQSTLLEAERVVSSGDVAEWFGDWSPDGRFYVYFRLSPDAPCTGEIVYAYDVMLAREIRISSDDYCTRGVDPDTLWDGTSTLLFGDGPDGGRWEAITLGDVITREPLAGPPPACVDRTYPPPDALRNFEVVRTRLSPDEKSVAVALLPDDAAHRFDGIPGNQPDLHLFQRLDVAVLPAEDAKSEDLLMLGPIFDLGPDVPSEEDCPGTQLRWSDNSRYIISSLGPVAFDTVTGEAVLAPESPNSGVLGHNLIWSPDDSRVADDRILFDLTSGQVHQLPGILPGLDRGFASNDRLVYVSEQGIMLYNIASKSVRQLTDFKLVLFVVAPDGQHLVYSENGNLWLLRLTE